MNTNKIKAFGFRATTIVDVALQLGLLVLEALINILFQFAYPAILIAEVFRVYYGIKTFEVHSVLAGMVSIVLVTSIGILTYQLEISIHTGTMTKPVKHKFSLRLLWQEILYFIGIGTNWKPKEQQAQIEFTLWLKGFLKIAFVLASILGSINHQLIGIEGAWYLSFGVMIGTFTLSQFLPIVLATLVSYGLVQASEVFAQYTAKQNVANRLVMQEAYNKAQQMQSNRPSTKPAEGQPSIVEDVSVLPKKVVMLNDGKILETTLEDGTMWSISKNGQVYTMMEKVTGSTPNTFDFDSLGDTHRKMLVIQKDLRRWKVL